MNGLSLRESALVIFLSPPVGTMSAMRRGSSSTRRTARVAAAPYPVHSYAQQDSTSSDSPAKPRSLATSDAGSTGSWQLTPAPGSLSAAAPGPPTFQRGGSSSSGSAPQVHLHRRAELNEANQYNQANQFVDESQSQHKYLLYEHQ